MASQKYTLTFDAELNINQMKGALSQIQGELGKLKLPANVGKSLTDTFDKLSKEVKNFESLISGGVNTKNDFTKLETSANKVLTLYEKLQNQVKNLGGLSSSQLEKLFPESVTKNITAARDAFAQYQKSVKSATVDLNKANAEIEKINKNIAAEKGKNIVSSQDYKQMGQDIKALNAEIEELSQKAAEALQKVQEKRASLKNPDKNPGKILPGLEEELKNIQTQLEEVRRKRDELRATKEASITEATQSANLEKLNNQLTEAQTKATAAAEALQKLQSADEDGGLAQLIVLMGQLTDLDMSQFDGTVEGVASALQTYLNNAVKEAVGNIQNLNNVMNQNHQPAQQMANDMNRCSAEQATFNERAKEIDGLKKRIQYFFGLANSINLVKRAIRDAFNTIKELDKVMTETAVVTDFSVSDMWSQLPEYTRRANELGVTTKAAYEAATLYYQQGLKTNEVNALSVETLKMARIAGLDAAEATDRMTNALRGFNMELTEANAQRVDDVYSELAANTASNVDEISTAMTKVASLAHNANMEFETTAAFLAQIIETTRESAETAGTALKTVVARFSEVKKLVSEGQLTGTDEEGQGIDVNRVGAALRTAGIDLNKYFLGEVGLDDIFMELASKWDNLTSVQQRYIATQAAGSRQQSRFIAMMQDYARTQELVGKAYQSNGASARQFAKTQESLESKLNRLKNAWNEFTMGLTNNVVVKLFVDVLTDLLNVINKITSAFGDGVGSILKWGVAIGTVLGGKSLFKTGGLLDSILGAITGNTIFGGLFGKLGVGGATTNAASATTAGVATGAAGGTAAKIGFGSLISGVGKKVWEGSQWLGEMTVAKFGGDLTTLSGTAAGLTGIATALGAIAAAAAAAYAAYKIWLKVTPEGQLKAAKKYAEQQHEIADEAKNTANNLKQTSQQYENFNNAVKSATTTSDLNKTIQDRNEYILSLLEQDKTYAKYIQSVSSEGQIILTLDEAALAKAAEEAAKTAVTSAAYALLADAATISKEANVTEAQISRAEIVAQADATQALMLGMPTLPAYDTSIIEAQVQAQKEEAKAQAQAAYDMYLNASEKLEELSKLSTVSGIDYSSLISNALSNAFDATTWQSIDWQDSIDKLIDGLLGESKADWSEVLQALSGDLFSGANIELTGDYDLDSGLFADKLQQFASTLGIDIDQLKAHIRAQAASTEQLKINRRANVYRNLLGANIGIDKTFQEYLNGLTLDEAINVDNFTSKLQEAFGQVDISTIFNTDQLIALFNDPAFDNIADFVSGLDFSNPILALDTLNNKLKEVQDSDVFSTLIDQIQTANANLFETGSLVQNFLLSNDFDGINDQLKEFIKANDSITADNVNELASSCKSLALLLEQDEINALGLSRVLTAYENNTVGIESITTAFIAAMGAGRKTTEVIQELHDYIANFDEGLDYQAGNDFFKNLASKGKELTEEWRIGDDQLIKAYNAMAGEGAYENRFLSSEYGYGNNVEQIQKDLASYFKLIDKYSDTGTFMDNFSGFGDLGITGKNGDYNWDFAGKTYDQMVEQIRQSWADKNDGQEIGEEFAQSILEGWLSYSPGSKKELDDNAVNQSIDAFLDGLDGKKFLTEQELQALADSLGIKLEDLEEKLQKKAEEKEIEIPIKVKTKDDNGNQLNSKELFSNFAQGIGIKAEDTGLIPDQLSTKDQQKLSQYASEAYKVLEDGTEYIDSEGLISKLIGDGFSEEEATSIANSIASSLGLKLGQEFQKAIVSSDGTITFEPELKMGDSVEAVTAGINSAMKAADYNLVAESLASDTYTEFQNKIAAAIQKGGTAGINEINTAIKNYTPPTVNIGFTPLLDELTSKIKAYVSSESFKATMDIWAQMQMAGAYTGGRVGFSASNIIIPSYAKGSNQYQLQPGFALTGEEGPEIVWNKEAGYSYITGQNGPEFQNLQPGDRVFNAQETSRILNNTDTVKKFGSFGRGKIPLGRGGGSGGSGSNKDDSKDSIWDVDLDWLYNLMEDISEYERKQTLLQTRYEAALTDQTKTGRDLYELTQKQLQNLYNQQRMQTEAYKRRSQEMAAVEAEGTKHKAKISGKNYTYDKLVNYNEDTKTIDIDWDKINSIKDEDQYNDVLDYISRLETIQSQMDDAESALLDIEGQIQELENRQREAYADFQDRVLNAVVADRQAQIDSLSELNKTLNDANTSILNSLQEEIAVQRQIRENTKTEENIADMEARLAYLQRDTTGANDSEIRQLQQQIAEARESYSDTLIDQSLERLSQANDEAAEQRERQIELMQAQLDYDQKSGALWDEVDALIAAGIDSKTGSLITGSALESLLQSTEDWDAMSQAQRDIWADELITSVNQVGAYLIEQKEDLSASADAIDSLTHTHGGLGATPATPRNDNIKKKRKRPGKIDNIDDPLEKDTGIGTDWRKLKKPSKDTGLTLTKGTGSVNLLKSGLQKIDTSTGVFTKSALLGLSDKLTAIKIDDSFVKLADIASKAIASKENIVSNTQTDNTFNINIDVASIADDYDVDRLVDRIKEDLFSVANYRNVNALGFIR